MTTEKLTMVSKPIPADPWYYFPPVFVLWSYSFTGRRLIRDQKDRLIKWVR